MLEEKDLQAIAQAVDSGIRESESRMMAYFESALMPKFDLLADGISIINEKLAEMPTKEDLAPIELRLSALEAVVRNHSREIAELKKAQ